MPNAVWFRNDLRTYDNPALATAMHNGPTIAIYCLCEQQWNQHLDAPAKRSLIIRQLHTLAESLAALNVPFIILNTGTFKNIPEELSKLTTQHKITTLYFNHEYALNEVKNEQDVKAQLSKQNIAIHAYHDQCLTTPGSITTQQGGTFHVFTAFKRALLKQFHQSARSLYHQPQKQEPLPIHSDLSPLNSVSLNKQWDQLWPAGENAAHAQLNTFAERAIDHYKTQRDFPALTGTSSLSPYLTIGVLSTTQCLQTALSINQGELDGGNEGISTWINELIWREFYRHLLAAYPRLSMHKPFKENTDKLPWQHNTEYFEQWKTGQTGYPLVDAAMRQLSETGWMHNRLRMVTAMFLSKHLFIDWRWGEQYFMETLIDGDLASNNGGWQWSASTGVDAAPYFRIFNPTRQSERFDPNGDFLRKYLHEFAELDARSIHNPTQEQRAATGYPMPIVDHKQATEQTKAWFKAL